LPDDAETAQDGGAVDEEGTILRFPPRNPSFDTEEEGALAYLYFEPAEEGGVPRRFVIKSNYVIVGRVDPKRGVTPEIDLSAVDSQMTVSRQHARIRHEKSSFTIEDLKSRNKTRLKDVTLTPLQAELLHDGDVVHFGSVRMVFKISSASIGR
jgi:pSer/pThr/pTyr-binding forkhead associated (FHA) protein